MYVIEGKGTSMSASTRCKLNTISSTKTEIVVANAEGEKLSKCVYGTTLLY